MKDSGRGRVLLTTSENIADLAAALAKAQGAFPAVDKGKVADAGTYSYAYADLADILQAVRKPLSDNGLAIIQPVVDTPEQVVLVTRLLHASGQWIESTYPVEMYEKPQETGSALTYARRYAITALLGIAAEEDDDGAAAQKGTKRPPAAPKKSGVTAPPKAGDKAPCPKCGKPAFPSKFPRPDQTHYCGLCRVGFVPPLPEPAFDDEPPFDPPDEGRPFDE